MNPAGALWQNELSWEVLNHTPSQEEGRGPEISRYLYQESVSCTNFISEQIIVSASGKTHRGGPKWPPQNGCCFCEVLCGHHAFPACCTCLARADTFPSPRCAAVTHQHEQWLIVGVEIASCLFLCLHPGSIRYQLWPWASYSASSCLGALINRMRLTGMPMPSGMTEE